MNSIAFKIRSFILVALLAHPFLFAQQKTGNIVEYFGKEKIENISEGKLIHVFKKGLALKVQNFGFNSSSFPKDPVFEHFLTNPSIKIKEDNVFDVDFMGNEMISRNQSFC